MKASKIKECLDQINDFEKTATNDQKSKLLLKKLKLRSYLDNRYKKPQQLNESFVAGSESLMAGDDDVYNYDLNISATEEQELQQTINDTISQFGNRW